MSQTIVTVAFEAQPSSVALLEATITAFRKRQESSAGASYLALTRDVPTLHFMSIMVFHDPNYDPLLLLEVNFDGPPNAFWASLAAAIGTDLAVMLSFCAPPRDPVAAKRFANFATGGEGLAEVLAAASVTPTAFHLGNRGLTRAQIEADAALFVQVQSTLNSNDAAYRPRTPVEIHRQLRDSLAPNFPWLSEATAPRIPSVENRADWVNILVFATLTFAVLALPGTVLALILPWWFAAGLGLAIAVALSGHVPDLGRLIKSGRMLAIVVIGIALLALLSAALWLGLSALALYPLAALSMLLAHDPPVGLGTWMAGAAARIAGGAICAPAIVLAILLWLRRIELRDSTASAPMLDEAAARRMAEREDYTTDVYQNHMGSLVLVKPGGLRMLLLRFGHHALHLALRIVSRDGYLSDMRTVHFAHWALLNDNSRLLFMSNFDGTWDSYLDDFIEKAHQGTTLAWTNSVGAPLAAFLALDGVTNGRQFKLWARRSMAPNLFWFSAYPKLTVNQIERNHRIAEGLRQTALDAGSAAQWIRSL